MNHYNRLRLAEDASPEEIVAAYEIERASTTARYSDSSWGCIFRLLLSLRIRRLSEARDTLIDPVARQEYDAMLKRSEVLGQYPPGFL